MTGWRFWIDRGGTFTDVVACDPSGRIRTVKHLSENPERYEDAALFAIRSLTGVRSGPVPAGLIAEIRMGTTVATNALLERRGEPTLLVITAGLRDILQIRQQNRPHLFELNVTRPPALYARVLEAQERLDARGEVVLPLDEEDLRRGLRQARADGLAAAAIVFMHAYREPQHERRAAELARQEGFDQVSTSHEAAPLMKIVPRGETAVADAYLSPVLARYVDRIVQDLGPAAPISFMQSNGGLVAARAFRGRDAVLSGPAGGIVGMARTCEAAGFSEVIGFDMGGTSTDVSHYAGRLERNLETEIAGVALRAPMMNIHTVAAGGGSVCRLDKGRFRVGPQSAGADPGPAAYRRGGPLTVTDCNVMTGKLIPEFFPSVFGPNGDEPLDGGVVRARFEDLARAASQEAGRSLSAEQVAEGFLSVAVDNMANAIKKVSVSRGYDVARYVLACFGGAGGQHACLVADALGMSRVLIHPMAGVLSAYGMGLADHRQVRQLALETELSPDFPREAAANAGALASAARAALEEEGASSSELRVETTLQLKYRGSDATVEVPLAATLEELEASFEAAYRRRFAFLQKGTPLVAESLAVEVIARSGAVDRFSGAAEPAAPGDPPVPRAERSAFMAGARRRLAVFAREDLRPGACVRGPAMIFEATSTTAVEPGWCARVLAGGELLLEREHPRPAPSATVTPDPVSLEIFANLFMAVAEQMGAALQNTAVSVNIKERLDFSCAVFDAAGALIANAPHMPVHLGSMGESVRAALSAGPGPGEVIALNNPYNGGTHLPDVTVVMPVFAPDGAGLLFTVAARGHHADIGGLTPGSMPSQSRRIEEEGVLIDNFLLVSGGRFRETELRALLATGPYPARNPDQNVADLKAQVAACARGAEELKGMMESFGADVVSAYMGHVKANAAECVRRMLKDLPSGAFTCAFDSGAVIHVRMEVDQEAGRAQIDFTGTSPELASNFNAPASICRAAVLYVLRTLIAEDIPLNDGCLEPVDLVIPEGSMLRPRSPAAVVAGNVETSQIITDTLYGACGRLAASQGTMNNFTFGDDERQYYETICGGAGAGPGFDGASAVQTHMTNSRLTDPEVLEWRYPVRLETFRIRTRSGGAGRWRGGDGVVRAIRFLKPVSAALLANRRVTRPFGLMGGLSGQPGSGRVLRVDGSVEDLGGTAQTELGAGDVFLIETPGGGGYGAPAPDEDADLGPHDQ